MLKTRHHNPAPKPQKKPNKNKIQPHTEDTKQPKNRTARYQFRVKQNKKNLTYIWLLWREIP